MHGHPVPRPNLKLWIIYQRASRSIIIYLCKSVIIRNSIAEASRYCNCYHKIFICFTSNIFISYTVLQRFVQQQICILLKGSRGLPRDGPVIQWKIDAGKRWERCCPDRSLSMIDTTLFISNKNLKSSRSRMLLKNIFV